MPFDDEAHKHEGGGGGGDGRHDNLMEFTMHMIQIMRKNIELNGKCEFCVVRRMTYLMECAVIYMYAALEESTQNPSDKAMDAAYDEWLEDLKEGSKEIGKSVATELFLKPSEELDINGKVKRTTKTIQVDNEEEFGEALKEVIGGLMEGLAKMGKKEEGDDDENRTRH